MWDLEMFRVLVAERLRETAREVAWLRLARAAEKGRRANGARSGDPDAGLGEAAPWWAVLRALRRRARPPVPRGNPDGCADQA